MKDAKAKKGNKKPIKDEEDVKENDVDALIAGGEEAGEEDGDVSLDEMADEEMDMDDDFDFDDSDEM